jgi:hypothetical protein
MGTIDGDRLSVLRDSKLGLLFTMPNQRSDHTLTAKCPECGAKLVGKPVPGAKRFPLRLECPAHGWQQEKPCAIRMRFHKDRPNW